MTRSLVTTFPPAGRCLSLLRRLLLVSGLVASVTSGVLVVAAVDAPPASATSSGEGWTLGPAPGPDGKAQPAFHLTVAPGGSVTDRIVLSNDTTHPLAFTLYSSDARNVPGDGAFALGLPGKAQHGVGLWTSTTVNSLVVPGLQAATFPFTVMVPANTQPGDYAGGVVALNTASEPSGSGHVHLNVLNGVGVRIYVRVPGALHPGLALGNVAVTTDLPPFSDVTRASHAQVRFTVSNTGNESLPVTARVRAVDLWGRTVKQFAPIVIPTLLPGTRLTMSEPLWRQLPLGGPIRVQVDLSSGRLHADGQAHFWIVPWTLVALIVVVVATAATLLLRRRQRRQRRLEDDEAEVEAQGSVAGAAPVAVPELDVDGTADTGAAAADRRP